MVHHSDVVIVGAGPAGSVLAFLLAQKGWEVTLLDRARFPREKTCGDGLTPRAVATLQRLGLYEDVAPRAFPVRAARLYAAPHADITLPFHPFVHPLPPEGLILPRKELDDLLRRRAEEAGAHFVPQARITHFLPGQGNGTIAGVAGTTNGHPKEWPARLTVMATGASIGLHKAMGILQHPPHDVRAARGYWRGVQGLEPRFEFFFTPELAPGYGWIFPVGEDVANVGVGVYAAPGTPVPSPVRRLHAFIASHPALRDRFAHAKLLDDVRSFPIRTDFPSHRICGPGWLMVGEATGLVNPVTGEGIDLAMESAMLAAEAIHRALEMGAIREKVVCRYERRLRRHFGRMFQGLRWLRKRVMRPRAVRILIQRAARHPGMAERIMGITLGTRSPFTAFLPSTWWWILRG